MAKSEVSRIDSQIAAFGNECSKSFSLLGDQGIRFGKPRAVAGQRMLVVLNGPGAVEARTDKFTYTAFPLPVSDLSLFWVASSIEFKTNKNVVTVDSASVVVFSGEAYNPDKVPILRAEWDNSTETNHAQPHWHVYTSRIDSLAADSEMFDKEPAFEPEQDVSTSIIEYIPKFHFAMCANWNTRDAHCVQTIGDMHCVADWIAHTVKYIQGQLSYTMRRHG